jgi:hypothetical protein
MAAPGLLHFLVTISIQIMYLCRGSILSVSCLGTLLSGSGQEQRHGSGDGEDYLLCVWVISRLYT